MIGGDIGDNDSAQNEPLNCAITTSKRKRLFEKNDNPTNGIENLLKRQELVSKVNSSLIKVLPSIFNFQLDIATGGHPVPLQFLLLPKPVRSEVNPELTMLACGIVDDSISAIAYRGGHKTLAQIVSQAGRLVYLRINLKPSGGVYNLVDSNGIIVGQEHIWFCKEFFSHKVREFAAKTALVAFKLWKEQADKNYAKEVKMWKID